MSAGRFLSFEDTQQPHEVAFIDQVETWAKRYIRDYVAAVRETRAQDPSLRWPLLTPASMVERMEALAPDWAATLAVAAMNEIATAHEELDALAEARRKAEIVERVRRGLTADRRKSDPRAREATAFEAAALLADIEHEDRKA